MPTNSNNNINEPIATESQNSCKNSSCIDLSALNNEEQDTELIIKNTNGYNTLPNIKSNNYEDDVTFKRKLEDLKTSYDQMIFKQSYRDMESLHKTLESMLGVDNSKLLKSQEIAYLQ